MIFHQPGPLRIYLRQFLDPKKPVRILYQPLAGDRTKHFETVNQLVMKVGNIVYAVDEIDAHCEPNYMPTWMYEIVMYGRHSCVSLAYTTRRHTNVARGLTSQTTEHRIFQMTEPVDLAWFGKIIGGAADQLPTLQKFQYLRWRQGEMAEIRGGRK